MDTHDKILNAIFNIYLLPGLVFHVIVVETLMKVGAIQEMKAKEKVFIAALSSGVAWFCVVLSLLT